MKMKPRHLIARLLLRKEIKELIADRLSTEGRRSGLWEATYDIICDLGKEELYDDNHSANERIKALRDAGLHGFADTLEREQCFKVAQDVRLWLSDLWMAIAPKGFRSTKLRSII